jgi:hypothetical protein
MSKRSVQVLRGLVRFQLRRQSCNGERLEIGNTSAGKWIGVIGE